MKHPKATESPNLLRDALMDLERRKHDTLGPCSFCEHPIAKAWITWGDFQGIVCDLCLHFTDTIFCRQFWEEYPANVI